jgi:membrane associated rhomboid family serine protease
MPLVVKLLLGAILVAYIPFFALSEREAFVYFLQYGVVPSRFATEGYSGDTLLTLVSHVFLHGGIIHLGMNALVYLQASPLVARRLGAARFLLLFFFSAVGGALTFVLINPASDRPMVGASGAICGVFAAYFLAWAPDPRDAFKYPQVRQAAISFLLINVVLAGVLAAMNVLPIAWEAHLGGFVAGAIAFFVIAPRRQAGPWDVNV